MWSSTFEILICEPSTKHLAQASCTELTFNIKSMHLQKLCSPNVCIFQTEFNEALLTTKKRAIREKTSSKKEGSSIENNLMADKSVFPLFLFVSLFLLKENLCSKNILSCRPTVF